MESNKMKGLFLDDERNPEDVTWVDYPENIEWTVVRSYDEFFYEFHRSAFQVFSFDHDIQDYNEIGVELTGYTVLKAMLDTFLTTPLDSTLFLGKCSSIRRIRLGNRIWRAIGIIFVNIANRRISNETVTTNN